jgi:hypothetical protein
MAGDLFGPVPQPHKTAVRGRLLALRYGAELNYQRAYGLTRAIPNKPVNWQANVRDELHRLWHRGYFTRREDSGGMIYTRTDKQGENDDP